jgi:hypothetical protein
MATVNQAIGEIRKVALTPAERLSRTYLENFQREKL